MNRKLIATTAACALAGSLAIGSTFAYLTDRQTAKNTFTVGSVEISLTEPNFKEENAQNILPNQLIAKDPTIQNTGKNDAIVFARVTVPTKTVLTAEEAAAGKSTADTTHELFTLLDGSSTEISDSYAKGTPDTPGWTVLSHTTGTGVNYYVLGYTQKIAPKGTAPAVFDSVRYLNVVEGQVSEELNVDVEAFAIQSGSIQGIDTSSLSKDTLKQVFDTYLNQNPTEKISTGAGA